MDTEAFLKAYNEVRNGTDHYYRHPLVPRFVFTDGVRECAEAGIYWLLDILATEVCDHLRASGAYTMLVTFAVDAEGHGEIVASLSDGDPKPWRRAIVWTDAPQGEWKFWMAVEDANLVVCCLLSEY